MLLVAVVYGVKSHILTVAKNFPNSRIARAFVANPKILLLDEATSSIDTVTELHIQAALEKLMQNRTSFIIAHRLNTVAKVDYVIVLNQGQIVEQGPRKQLIEQQGVFGQMLNV